MKTEKRFFSKHTKSSAAFVTLVLHGLFIIAGLSLVVMNTMVRPDPGFVHRVPVREHLPLPDLRPPSNARKPKPAKPNFERVPVNMVLDRKIPEVNMPDLIPIKSEIGGVAGSSGSVLGTFAFSMPGVEIFNVRGKGEKIFLILDAGEHMLVDEMGGIPAYTIIKKEMIRIIHELPSTAVFNICVFGSGKTTTLFPQLVAANGSNARNAAAWLLPLNHADESVETGRYGIQTLGAGGVKQDQDMRVGRFEGTSVEGGRGYGQERWYVPAMVAMEQQADTIFLLTNAWGRQRMVSEKRDFSTKEWLQTSDGKRWLEHVDQAKAKLAEENRRRKNEGRPPKVIANGRWGLIATYFPGTPKPPAAEFYHFTPADFQEAFLVTRASSLKEMKQGGIRKNEFTFNVVQFVPENSNAKADEKFKKLVRLSRGAYQTIAGLEAIRSYIESE